MKVYVLAAGQSSSFWPFSDIRPKALFPISGRPLIVDLLHKLHRLGECVVTVGINGYGHDYHLAVNAEATLAEFKVAFIDVGQTNGPAATLSALIAQSPPAGDFAVLYADVLYQFDDLRTLLGPSEQAQVLFRRLPAEETADRIAFNAADEFDFLYHPRRGGYNKEAIGYCLPQAFCDTLAWGLPNIYRHIQCGMMPTEERFIEPLFAAYLAAGHGFNAIDGDPLTINLDYPWHILQANALNNQQLCEAITQTQLAKGASISAKAILRGQVVLGENSYIGDNVIINGNVIIGDNTRVIDGAILGGNIIIGDRCEIKEYCKIFDNSTVGHQCIVGHGAELEGVILDKSYLYHYCEIYGVLGLAVDIGAGTAFGSLRFDDQKVTHKIHQRRLTPSQYGNAVYLGDFVRTGVNTTIMPGVKVGTKSVVSANLCLTRDLNSHTMAMLEQQIIEKPWGENKY